MSELPQGWEWTTIGEAGEVMLGRQRSPKWHSGPNMRAYLRVANVFEDRIDLSDVMEMDFPPDQFERFKLQRGDILLNEGQSPEWVGRPAMYRGELPEVCFTNSLIRFRPYQGVDGRYALYLFRHHLHARRFMREARITTNIAHLSATRFRTVEFPLPPSAEQERIVEAIEEHLSQLDAAERALSAARTRLAGFEDLVYRQAIELEGNRRRLGDVVRTTSGGTPSRSRSDFFGGPIPWIKSGELGDGSVKRTEETITESALKESSVKPVPEGTLLIAMYGATIGKLGKVAMPMATTNQAVAALYPSEELTSDFLWNVLRGLRPDLVRLGKGGAQPNISQSVLRDLEIPVPPVDAQMAANTAIDQSISVWRDACQAVGVASARSRALRHSIFAAAFTGRLVPQDSDEEPASVLLERIRAERTPAEQMKRKRKAKAS